MKRDVFVLTNINHYSDDALYVYSNAYGSVFEARNDMVTDGYRAFFIVDERNSIMKTIAILGIIVLFLFCWPLGLLCLVIWGISAATKR